MKECIICKRKIGKDSFNWILGFYYLKSLSPICRECDMCLNEQIFEILEWRIKELK